MDERTEYPRQFVTGLREVVSGVSPWPEPLSDLPCDSEPHGEALSMAELMTAAMLSSGEPNLGRVWSPGEGIRDGGLRAVAEAQRDQAALALAAAVREFCAAFRIPVPPDMKRAGRAILALGLNG